MSGKLGHMPQAQMLLRRASAGFHVPRVRVPRMPEECITLWNFEATFEARQTQKASNVSRLFANHKKLVETSATLVRDLHR